PHFSTSHLTHHLLSISQVISHPTSFTTHHPSSNFQLSFHAKASTSYVRTFSIMVRLKDRYLLVSVIYTDLPPTHQSSSKSTTINPPVVVSDLLLYNQPTSNDLRPQTLLKDIRSEITSLFGDCGAGKVNHNLQVKYFSPATSTFILRVSRDHYRLVWAALTFMQTIPLKNGRPCIYRVVRASGTMRKIEKETIRRARLLVLAARDEIKSRNSSDALSALLRSDNNPQQQRTLAIVGGQDGDDSGSEDGLVED
ncbi:putative ribonuclease P/MRP protein subunit POP5, partial [Triangularia setosa]